MHAPEIELHCRGCDWRQEFDIPQMNRWLLSAGSLRRAEDPEEDLVRQLFHAKLIEFRCPECGGRVSSRTIEPLDDAEWGGRPKCAVCGQSIPAERREVFPESNVCSAACAQQQASGEATAETEYCPHCGGLLQVAPRSGGGIARYTMKCSDCGRQV